MLKRTMFLFLVGLILASCAASYKPILPYRMSYGTLQNGDGINYSYRYGILTETGNKKYANKEARHGVKLIAIQVENTTDQEIILRENAKFYVGGKIIFPMEPRQLQQQIKQPAGAYMLWTLLWFNITKCENRDCTTIPIPLGLLIGLINTGKASGANKALYSELIANNILDKKIAPGEKVTGLIGISSEDSLPMEIKLSR